MNHNETSKYVLPTVLVINNNQSKLPTDSLLLASLNQVCMPILEFSKILEWIQQHQPDLIVLDIEWSQIINLQLIAALRLDWLTRNIPIMIITGSTSQQIETLGQLDYDAFLIKPYSVAELREKISSLLPTLVLPTPISKVYSQRV